MAEIGHARAPVSGVWRLARRDPWRKPLFLAAFTYAYFAWSLIPVAIAFSQSFNGNFEINAFKGLSLFWWHDLLRDPEQRTAMLLSLKLAAVAMGVAVPLGVSFAVAGRHWRGRTARGANFTMLMSLAMPKVMIATGLFLLFRYVFRFVNLGTTAEMLGLITVLIPYPFIVVRARLLSIDREVEEVAMDLGAPPREALRRVLLPLLTPAVVASCAIVFALAIDDFVTVNYLSGYAPSQPLSVKIYGARSGPGPGSYAAASFLLVVSMLAFALAFGGYRLLSRDREATVLPVPG